MLNQMTPEWNICARRAVSGIEKLLRYFLVFPYLIINVKGKPQHTNSKRKMPEHSDSLAMKVWVTLSDKEPQHQKTREMWNES